MSKGDAINPAHYKSHPSGIQAIDVIEYMPFNVGTAVKYLWRLGLKDEPIQELEKAIWYLQREVEKRKKEAAAPSGLSPEFAAKVASAREALGRVRDGDIERTVLKTEGGHAFTEVEPAPGGVFEALKAADLGVIAAFCATCGGDGHAYTANMSGTRGGVCHMCNGSGRAATASDESPIPFTLADPADPSDLELTSDQANALEEAYAVAREARFVLGGGRQDRKLIQECAELIRALQQRDSGYQDGGERGAVDDELADVLHLVLGAMGPEAEAWKVLREKKLPHVRALIAGANGD